MADIKKNNFPLPVPSACENCLLWKIVKNHCLACWQEPEKLNDIPKDNTLNTLGLNKARKLYRQGRISSTDLIKEKQKRFNKIIDLLISKKLKQIEKRLDIID